MNAFNNNLPLEVVEAAKNRARLTEAIAAVKKRLRPTEAEGESKKRSRLLHFLIALSVVPLGILLPPSYKIFAPFLMAIPTIIDVVNKARMSGEKHSTHLRNQAYIPTLSSNIRSLEPYTAIPKNPEDPRRYKPIG